MAAGGKPGERTGALPGPERRPPGPYRFRRLGQRLARRHRPRPVVEARHRDPEPPTPRQRPADRDPRRQHGVEEGLLRVVQGEFEPGAQQAPKIGAEVAPATGRDQQVDTVVQPGVGQLVDRVHEPRYLPGEVEPAVHDEEDVAGRALLDPPRRAQRAERLDGVDVEVTEQGAPGGDHGLDRREGVLDGAVLVRRRERPYMRQRTQHPEPVDRALQQIELRLVRGVGQRQRHDHGAQQGGLAAAQFADDRRVAVPAGEVDAHGIAAGAVLQPADGHEQPGRALPGIADETPVDGLHGRRQQ